MTERPHGYARYSLDGCRCYTCAWARAQYNDRREKLIRLGQWQPFVDPAGARAHAELLRAAGFGTRQIAALSGVNRQAVMEILSGESGRIRPVTHAAIVAVSAAAELAGGTAVPSVGTRRRAEALAAAGWSLPEQARALGWCLSNYHALLKRPSVVAHTARLVRNLYDRWSALPPPRGSAADRARRRALAKAWFPPMAWDEDAIDDPSALPCLLPPAGPVDATVELLVQHFAAGHTVVLTPKARAEVVRRMPDRSIAEVAAIIGLTHQRVSQIRVQMAREAA